MSISVDQVGQLLLDKFKEHAGDAWDELDAEAKGAVFLAIQDLAKLQVAHACGDALALGGSAMVKAEIANWTFVSAGVAQRALEAAAKDVALVLGKVLLTVVAGLV